MKINLTFIFILCFLVNSFAFDWVKLHNMAAEEKIEELALSKDNFSLEESYLLALKALNGHQVDLAERLFRKILQEYPECFEAEWGLAEVLRRRHNNQQAENILENLILKQPQFYPTHISLAYLKYLRMKFEEAADLALKIMRAEKDKVDLINLVRAYCLYAGAKGMLAHYAGPFGKAVHGLAVKSNLQKAERLQPKAVAVLFGLGSFYFLAPKIAGEDKEKALFYLTSALEEDPLFVDIYVRLAQLYKSIGEFKKHDFYLQKARQIDPQNELLLDYLSGECKFICK